MKIYYYVSAAMSGLCLVLSIIVLAVGNSNATLQAELQTQQQEIQKQQEQINTGNSISQNVAPKLLQDMVESAVKNDKMKSLLAKHGFNIQVRATPAPGEAASHSSTPAPPALRP